MKSTDEYIDELRNKEVSTYDFSLQWEISKIENYLNPINNNTSNTTYNNNVIVVSVEEIFSKGLLTETKWGQKIDYNNYAPYYECASTSNGRTLAGCVPVAMGQLIKYYQHPVHYNWKEMLNAYGTNEASFLLFEAVVSVDMDWGCGASSTYYSKISNALKNKFNYRPATLGGFSQLY